MNIDDGAHRLILDQLGYDDLKSYALAGKQQLKDVQQYLTTIAERARAHLNLGDMPKQEIIEKLYYVNGGQSAQIKGVTVSPTKSWYGPQGKILIEASSISSRERWYTNDQLHRVGAPAAIHRAFGKITARNWYEHGESHRLDGPAVEWFGSNPYAQWYVRGKLHRIGGPAKELHKPLEHEYRGCNEWYEDGVLHRAGGQPARDCLDGCQMWYEKGQRHRTDGPAITGCGGRDKWYVRGKPKKAVTK